MYLDSISLTRTLPCPAEPGKLIVIGKPSRSLAAVIPYPATLPDIIAYNPNTLTLTFRRPRGFMTLYVDDAEPGLVLLAAVRDAINAAWEHRAEPAAVTKPCRAPR
jgi:ArsR family metal-binding transcriptional regulator